MRLPSRCLLRRPGIPLASTRVKSDLSTFDLSLGGQPRQITHPPCVLAPRNREVWKTALRFATRPGVYGGVKLEPEGSESLASAVRYAVEQGVLTPDSGAKSTLDETSTWGFTRKWLRSCIAFTGQRKVHSKWKKAFLSSGRFHLLSRRAVIFDPGVPPSAVAI